MGKERKKERERERWGKKERERGKKEKEERKREKERETKETLITSLPRPFGTNDDAATDYLAYRQPGRSFFERSVSFLSSIRHTEDKEEKKK